MRSEDNGTALRKFLSEDMLDVLVRVGLITLMAVACFRIFAPFMNLLLWGLILAVALYPLHQRVARAVGGRQGRAAVLLVLVLLLLLGAPTLMLGSAFAGYVHETYEAFAAGTVTIDPPIASIADWPVVGDRLYNAWNAAATDLPGFLQSFEPQLGEIASAALGAAAGTMATILFFLGALVIAGLMMAFGAGGGAAAERILGRLAGAGQGPRLRGLIVATIRSVAMGVIGIAFIQALLLGVGFAFAGIPAAGLLALIVMLVGIIQLPAVIVSLPVVGYLWWAGDASTASNVVWSVYLLVAGMADNVLKPLLLGRGVDVPMPVILLGAMGGMVSTGIVGLFIGAVFLAVGYQLFMEWVDGPGQAAAGAGSIEGVGHD